MKTLVCLFVYACLACCYALLQDLNGKVLNFPKQTDDTNVRLYPQVKGSFTKASVCLRFMTDEFMDVFSLSTPQHDNGFLVTAGAREVIVWVGGSYVTFKGVKMELNEWQSVCATWDSSSGLVQLWLNGNPTLSKELHKGGSLDAPIIILGQDQDNYGGGFDAKQAFTGQIEDVHMWDDVLRPCDIMRYMQREKFNPGNALDWGNLEFISTGTVALEQHLTVGTCRKFQ